MNNDIIERYLKEVDLIVKTLGIREYTYIKDKGVYSASGLKLMGSIKEFIESILNLQ